MTTVMLSVVLAEGFHNPSRDWTHWGHSESEPEIKTHEHSLLTLEGERRDLPPEGQAGFRGLHYLWVTLLRWRRCVSVSSAYKRRLMGRASRMRQAVVSGERRTQKHGLGTEFLHVS